MIGTIGVLFIKLLIEAVVLLQQLIISKNIIVAILNFENNTAKWKSCRDIFVTTRWTNSFIRQNYQQ